MAALRAVHEAMAVRHPKPEFDGMHLLADDLARDPADIPDVPTVLHRHFEAEGRGDAEITWHELAWHGVTVAGPPISELNVWTDQDRLLAFTRDNLDTYWRAAPRPWPRCRPRARSSGRAAGASSVSPGCTTCWSPAR